MCEKDGDGSADADIEAGDAPEPPEQNKGCCGGGGCGCCAGGGKSKAKTAEDVREYALCASWPRTAAAFTVCSVRMTA
jgi:hypothetical protein